MAFGRKNLSVYGFHFEWLAQLSAYECQFTSIFKQRAVNMALQGRSVEITEIYQHFRL